MKQNHRYEIYVNCKGCGVQNLIIDRQCSYCGIPIKWRHEPIADLPSPALIGGVRIILGISSFIVGVTISSTSGIAGSTLSNLVFIGGGIALIVAGGVKFMESNK